MGVDCFSTKIVYAGPKCLVQVPCADPDGEGRGSGQTGLDPLKNHKAAKPVFNFGPPSAPAKRRVAGVPMIAPNSGIWFLTPLIN